MNKEALATIASAIVAPGKGILAADESPPTMGKRLAQIGTKNTEPHRQDFRQALFETPGLEQYISAAILFDETLQQHTKDGNQLATILEFKGIIPGIKVDQGAHPMEYAPSEKLTRGLNGLGDRCTQYFQQGARFAKWRAVITIGNAIPTEGCIETNAMALADYARICQEANLVPIVEPEVLMDGSHHIEQCYEVTAKTLRKVYDALSYAGVYLPGTLLKPNMILSGKDCAEQADSRKVAEMTLQCMKANVPIDVPGLVFLSGGQSELEATRNLNAINSQGEQAWALSFSFGRALQQSALHAWNGDNSNITATQVALLHRAKMNSRATLGTYSPELEEPANPTA